MEDNGLSATATEPSGDPHALFSAFREKIVEHSFVSQFLKTMWARGVYDVEVAYAEVDGAGYDLILSIGPVVRHVQLKAAKASGCSVTVPINARLAEKPSACVIWLLLEPDTLDFVGFRWFGGPPGTPIPNLKGLDRAKHTKANSSGFKADRRQTYLLPLAKFTALGSFEELVVELFG